MRFLLRRAGFFVLTLWACITLNFLLPRLMPGNPAIALLAKFRGRLNPTSLKAIEIALGVNVHQSLLSQYFSYLHNLAIGDFGVSITFFPDSVSSVIRGAILYTLGLVGVTTIIAFIVGTLIGIIGAWRRGGWLDSLLPPIFVIFTAIPPFWIGMLLILVFGIKLHWFPYDFSYDPSLSPSLTPSFIGNVIEHSILPAVALLVTSIGGWILTMRNTMITTLADDYVKMARAKGLSGRRIMLDYAARNAILPNLSGFAMSIGFIVSGAVLVEYVFNYNGLGYLLVQALDAEDYPLMQALFLLITVAVLLAILIADIVTVVLDPRTRAAR
jgi:peptide/nickel transport system permease protein